MNQVRGALPDMQECDGISGSIEGVMALKGQETLGESNELRMAIASHSELKLV